MEKEISTYLLKVYCGSMSNRDKGAYAVDIIANDIGIKDTDLLNVFMSDTKKLMKLCLMMISYGCSLIMLL